MDPYCSRLYMPPYKKRPWSSLRHLWLAPEKLDQVGSLEVTPLPNSPDSRARLFSSGWLYPLPPTAMWFKKKGGAIFNSLGYATLVCVWFIWCQSPKETDDNGPCPWIVLIARGEQRREEHDIMLIIVVFEERAWAPRPHACFCSLTSDDAWLVHMRPATTI